MNQEVIGNKIKEIRVKNELTQREFADILGVTFQAVSKWETGKCLPDLLILKEISQKFDIALDELLGNESDKDKVLIKAKIKKKKNYLPYIIIPFTLIIIIILLIVFAPKRDIKFKELTSNCDNFIITGGAAYNIDKAAIYISNVEFCGGDDTNTYAKIDCKLYEEYEGTRREISSCESRENITLEEYLKSVSLSANNYLSLCNNLEKAELYLEINATLDYHKDIVYHVPLKFEENCPE